MLKPTILCKMDLKPNVYHYTGAERRVRACHNDGIIKLLGELQK